MFDPGFKVDVVTLVKVQQVFSFYIVKLGFPEIGNGIAWLEFEIVVFHLVSL